MNVEDLMKLIRAVVREELEGSLRRMAREAEDYDGYETGELETSARHAIAAVAEATAKLAYHAPDCEYTGSYRDCCTCGVENHVEYTCTHGFNKED